MRSVGDVLDERSGISKSSHVQVVVCCDPRLARRMFALGRIWIQGLEAQRLLSNLTHRTQDRMNK